MKRSMFTAAVLGSAGVVTLLRPNVVVAQTSEIENVSGKWHIDQAGDTFAHGDIDLHMVGGTVVGSYGTRGAISGKMGAPSRLDATWTDERGTGWLTAFFDSDGKTINGEWGYQGRPVAGRFVGTRIGPES